MKLNRSLTIAIVTVAIVVCTSILLNGCASVGEGKDAAPTEQSSQRADKQGSAVKETGGSSAEAHQERVVTSGGSKEEPHAQGASDKVDADRFQQYAASVKQALDRFLPNKFSELNWNRIATVLVGLLMMSMIYGLAFALGRLPLRKRVVGSGGGGRQSGEQTRVSVSK